ncbi:hypothetical protein P170DRAFT_472100 [Aspergillus steynii IBT 23096]|uniref:Uncharacterized protein n=1 Tax=Aspergillus steynii IBT 23096 TaxID=1392250 RepID=A0A2I2GH40_9EURO|nr:uncharacterized protein P170DRAFT_472100 [Aspergillus steynii IBT 23096]PLB52194.1 hypothetical protein P170DRAFT_472100 [Aspergillus steynii IBT 23096]
MPQDIDPNARREVNNALISAGSTAVAQMIVAANSSIAKRRKNKEARAKSEAGEKAASEEKSNAAKQKDGVSS